MLDTKQLFLTQTTARDHYEALQQDKNKYLATYMLLLNDNVSLTKESKSQVLAAVLADAKFKNGYNSEVIDYLFRRPFFGIREIRDTIRLMQSSDSGLPMKCNRGKRSELSRILGNYSPFRLQKEYQDVEVWREVIDFLHTPEKVFQLPWFQKAIFGGPVPEESRIALLRSIREENALEVLTKHPWIPIKEFRKRLKGKLQVNVVLEMARRSQLRSLLRQRKDLIRETVGMDSTYVDTLNRYIWERLSKYDRPLYLNYKEAVGIIEDDNTPEQIKLSLSEQMRKNISRYPIPLPGRIRIICDVSESMSRAIEMAVHLSMILSLQAETEIVFVNTGVCRFKIGLPPKNILEAVKASHKIRAGGGTTLAMGLKDVLVDRSPNRFDSIILITDEEENGALPGHPGSGGWHTNSNADGMFAWAVEQYQKNYHPESLVQTIILNLDSSTQVTEAMKKRGLPVQRYAFGDLSSLENLLLLLNVDTPLFRQNVDQLSTLIQRMGIERGEQELKQANLKLSQVRTIVLTQGICNGCSAPLKIEQVNDFRMGVTIKCEYCDSVFNPSLFG